MCFKNRLETYGLPRPPKGLPRTSKGLPRVGALRGSGKALGRPMASLAIYNSLGSLGFVTVSIVLQTMQQTAPCTSHLLDDISTASGNSLYCQR